MPKAFFRAVSSQNRRRISSVPGYLSDEFYNNPVAFEGAMGYGANATGGRGDGTVNDTTLYFVDNLNDSGEGSLRAAVEAAGKRVIVPRVSGYVNISSELVVSNPNMTFLGQLSPGAAIAVKPASLPRGYRIMRVDASNVIVRYLTLRGGEVTSGYSNGDILRVSGGGPANIIFDHMSMAFSTDEILDVGGVENFTIQNSLSTYPLENAGDPESNHGYYALTNGGTRTSHLYNLVTNVRARTPESWASEFQQWIGNTIYNWADTALVLTKSGDTLASPVTTMDMRRNSYLAAGTTWQSSDKALRFRSLVGTEAAASLRAQVYLEGNNAPSISDPTILAEQSNMARVIDGGVLDWPNNKSGFLDEWVTDTPIGTVTVLLRTAAEADTFVRANAGNSIYRDSLDTSVVQQIASNSGAESLPSSVEDAGGYPTLSGVSYPAATDGVIADAWRDSTGETRDWYELDTGGTNRMIIENYADDVAEGRFVT